MRMGLGTEGLIPLRGSGVVDRFYTIRPGLVDSELMVAF